MADDSAARKFDDTAEVVAVPGRVRVAAWPNPVFEDFLVETEGMDDVFDIPADKRDTKG